MKSLSLMCLCVGGGVHVWGCVHKCVEVISQCWASSSITLHMIFSETGSLLSPVFSWWANLPGQPSLGTYLWPIPPLSIGVTDTCHHTQISGFLRECWWSKPRSSCLYIEHFSDPTMSPAQIYILLSSHRAALRADHIINHKEISKCVKE